MTATRSLDVTLEADPAPDHPFLRNITSKSTPKFLTFFETLCYVPTTHEGVPALMLTRPGSHVVLIAGAVALLALGGCASRGSVRQAREEITAVTGRVEELQKAQESSGRELAKTVGELKALESQITRLAQAERGAGQQVARVEKRLGETEEALRELRAAVDGISREVVRPAMATPPPQEKSVERNRTPRPGPAEQAYAAALASFRGREHGQAVLEFMDFIARYPQHPLAPTAQFWIAEAYYLQRDYRQALTEYQKAVQVSAKGEKAPDALLKLGLSFRALNDPDRARETWRELVQSYPESEAARQARALLQARAVPARRAR